MVVNASVARTTEMEVLLDEVTGELVRTDLDASDGLITLPSTYPGGAPVIVRIRREHETFIVTDQGNGFLAAEMLGGSRTYAKIAPGIAQFYGVQYDGDMMFAVKVPRNWLANAIIFTGSASRRAVERTAEKMAEEKDASFRDILRERVRDAFSSQASFNISLRGRSTKEWHFPAQAKIDGRRAVFDIVTPHAASVAAAFIKFQDISDLEDGVEGVAVASTQLSAPDKTLISKAARSVIQLDDPKQVFLRAA